jgi:hypothetical protein
MFDVADRAYRPVLTLPRGLAYKHISLPLRERCGTKTYNAEREFEGHEVARTSSESSPRGFGQPFMDVRRRVWPGARRDDGWLLWAFQLDAP